MKNTEIKKQIIDKIAMADELLREAVAMLEENNMNNEIQSDMDLYEVAQILSETSF